MAYPTDTYNQTDLASEIPLLWGERLNDFFKAKLTAAPFFTDRSAELADGGKTLYTPQLQELSATAKSNATAVTLSSPVDASVVLTVSNWFEVSFAIEDLEAAQVKRSYSLMERYAKNAAYAIARKLDTALVTLFSNFTPSVGTGTASNVADSDIRSAIAQLESANVDSEEAAFFFHPNTFWNQVQALDKFSLAVNSPVNDPTAKPPAAYLYGRKVYVTSQILNVSGTEGRVNALAHPDAIHFATSPLGAGSSKGQMVGSSGIRVQSNYIPEYLSTVTTADIAYGVVLNRATAGVRIMTAE